MRYILRYLAIFGLGLLTFHSSYAQENLQMNDRGYFHMQGLDITFFSDFYPEGHQSGVTIIQHGNRVAANGDIRLEPSPGQWSPIPKGGETTIGHNQGSMSKTLWYPDSSKNMKGKNPIEYPDLTFKYHYHIIPIGGNSFKIIIDLDEPLPEEWIGKVGFNLELFPGDLFGRSYLMDDRTGIFPLQAVGPMTSNKNDALTRPLASGYKLVIAPEKDRQRLTISSENQPLELRDGRSNHNNGWFIVRSTIASNATMGAIDWTITPNVIPDWTYSPVIQVSQLGYHPDQQKIAVVEIDPTISEYMDFKLYKLTGEGKTLFKEETAKRWGPFLRYNYLQLDFSDIKEQGMYQLAYGETISHPFQIAPDVYQHNTWQPTLDYYLPVQMCHMRINEKYRVWHDLCHMDDALMAPTDHNHFDGYRQGAETYVDYQPGDAVPGLNSGGWHDAGDYDLRVESQATTVRMLALMIEEFGLDYDATMIDQVHKVVEIHVPDGKSDAIQQIEHGLEAILGGYRSLGRLYRGIICPTLRQYVMLGDAASMTDNLVYDKNLGHGKVTATSSSVDDDRWVFTEDNPRRELGVSAALAAASRVLKESNPELSTEALTVALALWEEAKDRKMRRSASKIDALCELILTTKDAGLMDELISMQEEVVEQIEYCGPALGQVIHLIDSRKFKKAVAEAVTVYQAELAMKQSTDSPYGVPYEPNIWGAGWNIQSFGVKQYFFHKGWPELTPTAHFENALNFILGVHPGVNNDSFASGVGAESVTVAYGVNRADWSFIPGGVVSGTALIRPDLPEMKVWPYFWQQTEYVMGGGATNFMFLVLAVDNLYSK
jgi:endoglucanase